VWKNTARQYRQKTAEIPEVEKIEKYKLIDA